MKQGITEIGFYIFSTKSEKGKLITNIKQHKQHASAPVSSPRNFMRDVAIIVWFLFLIILLVYYFYTGMMWAFSAGFWANFVR